MFYKTTKNDAFFSKTNVKFARRRECAQLVLCVTLLLYAPVNAILRTLSTGKPWAHDEWAVDNGRRRKHDQDIHNVSYAQLMALSVRPLMVMMMCECCTMRSATVSAVLRGQNVLRKLIKRHSTFLTPAKVNVGVFTLKNSLINFRSISYALFVSRLLLVIVT